MNKLQRGSPSLTDLSVRKVASIIDRLVHLHGPSTLSASESLSMSLSLSGRVDL